MYKEVEGREAMGYLSTKPTMVITTLHQSGIVNAGVFGAYTNLSPTQVGIAIARTSHTYSNIIRSGEWEFTAYLVFLCISIYLGIQFYQFNLSRNYCVLRIESER